MSVQDGRSPAMLDSLNLAIGAHDVPLNKFNERKIIC
jgi:hypothetical protein